MCRDVGERHRVSEWWCWQHNYNRDHEFHWSKSERVEKFSHETNSRHWDWTLIWVQGTREWDMLRNWYKPIWRKGEVGRSTDMGQRKGHKHLWSRKSFRGKQGPEGGAEVSTINKLTHWEAGGGMSSPHRNVLRMLARAVLKIVREPWAKGT